jgi:branched-chain amino acid transport system permease protein
MTRDLLQPIGIGAVVVAALAAVPFFADGYGLSLGIGILSYVVLATAWAMFSGPTRYISLATVAFFGVGAYTVAVVGEVLPWPLVLLVAGVNGVLLSLAVGLSTMRLAGAYFVIFTFGLTELIRQLVTWYEVRVSHTIGRYVFLDITQEQIYWQLLALGAVLFLTGFLIGRSRLGFALNVIGGDETVARHVGLDVTRVKVSLFALSALFMALTGAIMAPRWTYIDPAIAFNPVVSFQVVIMALLGGVQRLWGPLVGVIPLTLLFEYLNAYAPNHFSLILGLVFLGIVYLLPRGVAGLLAAEEQPAVALLRRLKEKAI